MRQCSIPGCEKPYRARGWCIVHWKHWRKYGDPLMVRVAGKGCLVDGCDAPHSSHGYCGKHYLRWKKYGDTDAIGKSGRKPTPLASKINLNGLMPSDPTLGRCHEWTACIDRKGYGSVRSPIDSVSHPAHRVLWELTHGPLPAGYDLHHRCENKACVNVGHLELLLHGVHSSLHRRLAQTSSHPG